MNPLLQAALRSWSWRWEVIIPLLLLAGLYSRGWWVLRGRGRLEGGLVTVWRLAAYWVGLLLLALSLLSPIDTLSSFLFFMHMVQHLFMVMFAPPLLMIANPLPFLLWGLPDRGRVQAGRLLNKVIGREAAGRRWVRSLLSPGVTWMLFVIVLWGWHDPFLYNAALQYEWVHNLEHLTFFTTAMLFWWRITGAGPKLHQPLPLLGRAGLAIAGVPPNMILGVFLAFSSTPMYSFYENMPRITRFSVLEDQALSGLIMWIPGSMMYILAALVMLFVRMKQEEQKVVR
ncbi:MAG: cytochrome c oxidase assembly protein [Anaerolineae bacterium]|nr:cytochrome c oxidase assembly protein [Anaerolineae bacterium]